MRKITLSLPTATYWGQRCNVLANWKKLGVSYVANAGHALTADNATNATKINGHGLVRFDTLAELEAAVKIEGTLYYAPYDEE